MSQQKQLKEIFESRNEWFETCDVTVHGKQFISHTSDVDIFEDYLFVKVYPTHGLHIYAGDVATESFFKKLKRKKCYVSLTWFKNIRKYLNMRSRAKLIAFKVPKPKKYDPFVVYELEFKLDSKSVIWRAAGIKKNKLWVEESELAKTA